MILDYEYKRDCRLAEIEQKLEEEEELRRKLEKMKERLDREIQEAFRTAYEMYFEYQRKELGMYDADSEN